MVVNSKGRVLIALIFPAIFLCFVETSVLSLTQFYSILHADSELGTFSYHLAVSICFFSCKLCETFNGDCSNNRPNTPTCHAPLTFKRLLAGITSLSILRDTCSAKPTGNMHLI